MRPLNIKELKPVFVERIKLLLPDKRDFERYKKILKIPPVKSIRCNTLKISLNELKKRLEEKNWSIKHPWQEYPEIMIVEGKYASGEGVDKKVNGNKIKNKLDDNDSKSININNKPISEQSEPNKVKSLTDLEPGGLGRALEHMLGYYYIQELASMLPVIALAPKPDEFILDLAAAPGSKTTQISAEMKNTGTIIANDVSIARIKILASNLERCGCSNVVITRKDGIHLCQKFKNINFIFESLQRHQGDSLDAGLKTRRRFLFSKILVDTPCSGEGTLRSSPKTALMWNPHTITSLSKLQKKLVENALEILKPNGILVYSTCTHAPEENEEVMDYILNKFKGKIKIEKINLPTKTREGLTEWQGKTYNQEVKLCARIYPHDNNTEGFFIAKVRKLR